MNILHLSCGNLRARWAASPSCPIVIPGGKVYEVRCVHDVPGQAGELFVCMAIDGGLEMKAKPGTRWAYSLFPGGGRPALIVGDQSLFKTETWQTASR